MVKIYIHNKMTKQRIPEEISTLITEEEIIMFQKLQIKLEELNNWVYFVHSYHAVPDDLNIVAAQVNYGSEKLTAMIESDNLLACQFHPEKSGKTGEKLLRRWISNIQ